MSDLFKAFEKFLFRDVSFVLGGGVLLSSGMYVLNRLPTAELPAFKYFIWAGISYAVGYSVQEVFTFTHIVRTKAAFSPNWVGRFLYRLFDRKYAKRIDPEKYERAKRWLYEEAPERFRSDHERVESLKHIGTALGPCFVVAGCILWRKIGVTEVDDIAARGLVGLGVILILLSWLKVTQQSQYLLDRYDAAQLG